jgi:phosphomannomutase
VPHSPIHFGTSGWRAIIADEFTFANVRLAVTAIAGHVSSRSKKPVIIVAHDTRFFSEEFARAAAQILDANGIKSLVCDGPTPTPAVAVEIRRRRTDGAINFTASHNPFPYHGLKFSGPDGAPAMPEVTKDIEARSAKLASRDFSEPVEAHSQSGKDFEGISLRVAYLKRLGELVRFEVIEKAAKSSKGKSGIVYDAVHGCGAGYLDLALANHGIPVTVIRANRDVLFDGTGPDVTEDNLAPLREAVLDSKASVGLATDGDADRFGIIDADGTWISPNHILALVYDYLVESRGWKMDAGRSVATSHMMDAVAKLHGRKIHQTPVGFKYIGELIEKDEIALGGEESAGLSIRGHVPEKDGILACLLVAEMNAARGTTLSQQIAHLFRRVGSEFWPIRSNLHLTEDVQAQTMARLKQNHKTFLGKPVRSLDRTDGLKMEFDDKSWVLLRMSGTEPLLRVYTEAGSQKDSAWLAEETRKWIFEKSDTQAKANTVRG